VPKGRPKPDISTPAAVKKALLAATHIGYEDPDFTVAGQRYRKRLGTTNLQKANSQLSEVDSTLGDLTDLLQQAQTLAWPS